MGIINLRPTNKTIMMMRKSKQIMLSLAAMIIMAAGANAQEVKGTNFLNAGVGIGTFGFHGNGIPITASFEHGFTDKISAGVTVGYARTKVNSDYRYTYYLVGARGSYHFNELLNVANEQLDIYGGASLFYRGFKARYKGLYGDGDFKASGGGLDIAIHAGARYMFAGNIGGYAELGYGISPLQLGVSFTF